MLRGIFSLIGLLLTVAIIVWIWSSYSESVVQRGDDAREMANSVVGNAPNGTPAIDSVALEPEDTNGQFRDILVKSVVPDGIMEKYYGLQNGDKIIEIGPLAVKDTGEKTSMALMQEAYMRKQELTVLRDGHRLTLPSDSKASAPGSAAELQRGLERVPTH